MSLTVERKTPVKTPTIGALADQIWKLKQAKKDADAVVKAIEADITAVEEQIFAMLDAQETRKGEGKLASISINSSVQANTEDWNAFMDFVAAGKRGDKKAYLHLVQRRVSVEAYRELLGLGINVPGLKPFTKRTLSVTTLSS
jgi:hypothetical protein